MLKSKIHEPSSLATRLRSSGKAGTKESFRGPVMPQLLGLLSCSLLASALLVTACGDDSSEGDGGGQGGLAGAGETAGAGGSGEPMDGAGGHSGASGNGSAGPDGVAG